MDVDTGRPAGHIMLDLGLVTSRSGDDVCGTATVVPEMWVPGTTNLRTSILATWVDHVCGLAAIGVLAPRVPVTLELDVHVYDDLPADGTINAVARVLKAGRSVVVCGVDVTGGDGSPMAIGNASFMAAPDPGLALPEGLTDQVIATTPGRLRVPFAERAACERRAPGTAVLRRSEDGLNAAGTINGGLIALLVEEAALSLAPAATLTSMALRYLRPVRTGPAVATATERAGLARVEVRDEGGDHRAVVTATTRATRATISSRGET